MMNKVSLKLNPYKDFNTISLNEQNLSIYSELNSFMKEPFLKWADRFLDSVERELNDEFELCVHSEKFEFLFFQALIKNFEDCTKLTREPFDLDYTLEERKDFLKHLSGEYPVTVHQDAIPIYVEQGVFLNPGEGFRMVSQPEDAFVILAVSDASFQKYFQIPTEKIIVYVTEEESLEKIQRSFLWKMLNSQVMDFLAAVRYRFYEIPYLIAASEQLKAVSDTMTEEQKKYLELMTATDPYISVGSIPKLEAGKSVPLTFEMIPATAAVPQIRIHSLNESVVWADGTELMGMKSGTTVVEFYKNEEMIPFDRREVCVFQNNSVQKIDLRVYATVMGMNYTQTIGAAFFPQDADDIRMMKWQSSDPNVVSVEQNGKIVSHRPGTARITLSGREAKAFVDIEVRPQLQQIELSLEEVACYVGDVIPVQVKTAPSYAYNREVTWWTSDKMVSVVETTASGDFRIRAIGIGQCTLTCKAKEGTASASIEMLVDSTFNKRKKRKGSLFRA